MKVSKYRAVKVEIDGIIFASKAEGRRYGELKLLARAGEITNLTLQPKFLLTEKALRSDGQVERASHYVGDFEYTDRAGQTIVEDTKGMRTPIYIQKRKLMLTKYGISILETK